MKRLFEKEAFIAYLFILPSLIGFIVFFVIPAVRSVVISFTDWHLVGPATYKGFKNYETLINDEKFWESLKITVTYVLWNIPIQTVIAMGIALVMNRIHNSSFLRGVLVIPWLLPNVVVGLLWLWIMDPTLGILNAFLNAIGIPRQSFLGSPDQAIMSVAIINIWRHAGYTSLLIFAGLKTIPKTLFEAASIDGANEATQFWRITLPLLRPVLVFVLVTSIVGSFQVFDTVAITTPNGGPAGSTAVIIWYIYNQVFNRGFQMGIASAASVVLFLILVIVTALQTRLLNANRSELAEYS